MMFNSGTGLAAGILHRGKTSLHDPHSGIQDLQREPAQIVLSDCRGPIISRRLPFTLPVTRFLIHPGWVSTALLSMGSAGAPGVTAQAYLSIALLFLFFRSVRVA